MGPLELTPLDAEEAELWGQWVSVRGMLAVVDMVEQEAKEVGFYSTPGKLHIEGGAHPHTWDFHLALSRDLVHYTGQSETDWKNQIDQIWKINYGLQRYRYSSHGERIALRSFDLTIESKTKAVLDARFQVKFDMDYGPAKIWPYRRGNGTSPNTRTSPVIDSWDVFRALVLKLPNIRP